jgi:hypothetical protein
MQPTDSLQLRDSVRIYEGDVAGGISSDGVYAIFDQGLLFHDYVDVAGVDLELDGDVILCPAEMDDFGVSEPG